MKYCIRLLGLLTAAITMASCANSSLGRLVGNDRDEHGCLSSAGYTWSYAMHDCVRPWEAGVRMDGGPKAVFVIFSRDSLYAEAFVEDGHTVLCKREKKTTNLWTAPKGRERVTIANGVMIVRIQDFDYTKSIKK